MQVNEKDLSARKAAADAMGVNVRDVKIVRGIPEFRPKAPERPARRRGVAAEKQAGKHVFVIGQGH